MYRSILEPATLSANTSQADGEMIIASCKLKLASQHSGSDSPHSHPTCVGQVIDCTGLAEHLAPVKFGPEATYVIERTT
jgi:hypothetical protein